MTSRLGAALAAIALLLATALGPVGLPGSGGQPWGQPWGLTAASAQGQMVIDRGHVDAFNVTADASGIYLDLKEDLTGYHVRRAPEDVIFQVNASAWRDEVPGLGVSGYLLPLTQDPNLIWPGWDTQGVAEAGLRQIDIEFTSVAGPGRVFLFTQGGLAGGPEPLLNNGLELVSGSVRSQPDPAHVHAYWLFEQPGTYTMTVAASSPETGQRSEQRTYTWVVGDGEAAGAGAGAGGGGAAAGAGAAGGAAAAAGAAGTSAAASTGAAAPAGQKGKAANSTAAAKPSSPAKAGSTSQGLANTGAGSLTVALVVLALGVGLLGAALLYAVRR